MNRYQAEIDQIKRDRERIQQRIKELKQANIARYGLSGLLGDNDYNKRIQALYGCVDGLDECLCFLARYNRRG